MAKAEVDAKARVEAALLKIKTQSEQKIADAEKKEAERLAKAQGEMEAKIAVRPSRIPSLCTRSTRAGIEWCCCHRAVCMAQPR